MRDAIARGFKLFGWGKSELDARETVAFDYFLSLVARVDKDSISYTVYRGAAKIGSRADCLVVGFGLDLLDREPNGFILELFDGVQVRGANVTPSVASYHKRALHLAKTAGIPLYDALMHFQDRAEAIASQQADLEEVQDRRSSALSKCFDDFDNGELTRQEFRVAIISAIFPELEEILNMYDSGAMTQAEVTDLIGKFRT